MDPLTHAFASYTLKRAAFSRAPRAVTFAILIAGTIADLDAFSRYFGPSAYLALDRTYFHSLLAAPLIGLLATLPFFFLKPKNPESKIAPATILIATLAAALLHLALDVFQSSGLELFWPFSTKRLAEDWLGNLDPVILAVLGAGLLLPELLHLVSSEIGAHDKKPRGQKAAFACLAVILLYAGFRAEMHSSALAALEARTYHGELPRRVAAFPQNLSPTTWNGVVETERSMQQLTVSTGFGSVREPVSGPVLYKPEPSSALDAARDTEAARKFLAVARFPKATVERMEGGYEIELRDLRYAAVGETSRETAAIIILDAAGKVTKDELVWARDQRRH